MHVCENPLSCLHNVGTLSCVDLYLHGDRGGSIQRRRTSSSKKDFLISGLRAGRMESPLAGNENMRGGIHFWEKLRTTLGHAILEMHETSL